MHMENNLLRIAIQAKGRLNEDSMALLRDIGIRIDESKRKFLAQAPDFPLEVLYLRDDDIPQVVAAGTADLGIVGLNEVAENSADGTVEGSPLEIIRELGFGQCRISLAVPKAEPCEDPAWFNGKRIATSYPNILRHYLAGAGVDAVIEVIAGSVEVAPAAGISDAIFDIVSSGGTLVSNGLKEVEKVFHSQAVRLS
jgi:ATP phosphoribosyltransferase